MLNIIFALKTKNHLMVVFLYLRFLVYSIEIWISLIIWFTKNT